MLETNLTILISPNQIKELLATQGKDLIEIRHYLHAHPELSFEEEATASYICQLLSSWHINYQEGVGGHGITGLIKGRNSEKKVIALRADMDALPIAEENIFPYASLYKGKMHACGHDVHMTCLLGALKLLNELKEEFEGTIKFIFQPAEESLPGGSIKMIEAGVLENPRPDYIFAQHVYPELEAGKVGFRTGRYMASSDEINLYINGKGGHAAMPSTYDNTVLAAANLLIDLQKVLKKNKPAHVPSVLAFGKVVADGAHNVIPSGVSLHGTFRTFDEDWRLKVHQLIEQTARDTAGQHHTQCRVVIDHGYPVLINDEVATSIAREAAIEFLGKENVAALDIRMTVEDFARYGQVIPACFYRLGTGNKEQGITSNLHTSTFDVDEKSIVIGTGLMVWLCLKGLQEG